MRLDPFSLFKVTLGRFSAAVSKSERSPSNAFRRSAIEESEEKPPTPEPTDIKQPPVSTSSPPKAQPFAWAPAACTNVISTPPCTPIGDIAAPKQPMFGNESVLSPRADTDMKDVAIPQLPSPPLTPPRKYAPASQNDGNDSEPTEQSSTQAANNTRQRPKRDFTAKVSIEEDDGTLPEGYSGTFEGVRFYQPKRVGTPSCSHGFHELCCGHWIYDKTPPFGDNRQPCGLNCAKPSTSEQPFDCPQCRKLVSEVIDSQLTGSERVKLNNVRNQSLELYAVYLVEFVTRRIQLTGNVTETVLSIVKEDYGRACQETEPIEPTKFYTVAEWAQIVEEARERWRAAKDDEEIPAGLPSTPSVRSSPSGTYPPSNDDQQPTQSSTASVSSPTSLQGGRKRAVSSEDEDGPRAKRVVLPQSIRFGVATLPSLPPSLVGPLVRKRRSSDHNTSTDLDISGRQKRGRFLDSPDGSDDGISQPDASSAYEHTRKNPFTKKKDSLPIPHSDGKDL